MTEALPPADRRALVRSADLTGAAALWLDGDWRVAGANDAAAALLGRPRADVVGRAYLDLLPQQTDRPAHDRLRRAMAERRRDTVEGYAPDVGRWVRRECFPTDDGGLLVLVRDAAERHRADADRVREQLEAVGEALPDAVIVVDEDRRPLFTNAAARGLFGDVSTVEVLAGASSLEAGRLLADPESFAADTEALYAAGEPGARTDVALADGRTLARDYSPISLGPGGPSGHVWTFRDVSGVRDRERRVERQRSFLAHVADAVPDTLYLYGLEADAYELLNDGDGDALERLRPALGGPARHAERAALGDGAARTERHRVPDAGGAGRWVEVRESAFERDADGRVSTVIGLLRDVSAQAEAEAALREQGEFVATLLQGVPDLVYVVDTVRNVNVWANREITAVLGYTQDDLHALGDALIETIIHPEDLPRLPAFWEERAALPARAFAEIEYRVRRKDGAWRWLFTRETVTERDADGRPLLALGVAQDVTAQREAREELAAWGRRQGRVARALQSPLLAAPRRGGAARAEATPFYRPISDEAAVGGDFFDVVDLGAGRTALVVGDVTGKGLRAAANTAQAKFMLRALLLEGHGPVEALRRLNAYVLQDGDEAGLGADLFVAVVVAVLDAAERTARFGVAGAEPPLILRSRSAGGPSEVVRVSCGGVPLAFLPRWEQDGGDGRVDLGPDDLVVLYTDGLTEAPGPDGALFGVEGVERALGTVDGSRPLGDVAEALADAALGFAGGHRHDDVCLLVGRVGRG